MNNTTEKSMTSGGFMRTLSMVYMAIILGLLFFIALSYAQGGNRIIGFSAEGDIWTYIVPSIAMISYFGGNLIFNRILSNIAKNSSLILRSTTYLRATVIRYAFLEGAAFIGVIAYRENHNVFHLVIVTSLLLYLIKLRPTRQGVIRDLGLEGRDRETFLKKEMEIL